MKKSIQIFAVLLLLALASGALADAKVEFVNKTDLFDFKPGSVYQVTDLFESFKDVVPGDKLTQKITVRNGSDYDVRIYMQATPETYVTTEQKDFLDQLRLTVKSGNSTIFSAQADESAQLTQPKLLGSFQEGGKVELEVTLEVPHDLGNEYMGQIGVVPWTFIVEEIPDETGPHTGDWYDNAAWIALAGALVLAIVFVLLLMKKRKAAN